MPEPPTEWPAPSASHRPMALIAVERAIAELRRGGIVALRGTDSRVALVLAAEMAMPTSLSDLANLSGSAPVLALTTRRMAVLAGNKAPAPEPSKAGEVQTLALPPTADDRTVRALIDPTVALPADLAAVAAVGEPAHSPATAAILLAKWARLLPAVLLSLAPQREPEELERWARAHALLLVERTDVDRYPALAASRLTRVSEAKVPLTDAEDARIVAFRPRDGGGEHLAILIGDPPADRPILTRLHSQCFTGDIVGSLRCDCGDQLRGAIRQIAASGGGVVLYLAQEGRDIGLVNKLRAYELQDRGLDTFDANEALGFDDDERVFEPAATMLRSLGFARVRLLTNNPRKVDALIRAGVEVIERVPHRFPATGHNRRYLATKARRAGHDL